MDLTELVAEMEKEGRHPDQIIRAHKLTLAALVEIAERLGAVEARIQELEQERVDEVITAFDSNGISMQSIADEYGLSMPVKRGPGRPRKTAE